MWDSVNNIWSALQQPPLIIMLYDDYGLLESAQEEVASIANPSWPVQRVSTVDEALSTPADTLALLAPADEVATVEELDGGRDRFVDRVVPVVVFLLRGGSGERALAKAPSLLSWVRSNLIDPSVQDQFDADAAREEFIRFAGKTPEEWLAMRSRGELDGSPEHLGLTYRALLLEGPDDLA